MAKKTRILAGVLALLLVLFTLSASALAVAHTHHDCVGEGCEICEQIGSLAETLKKLSAAVALIAVGALLVIFLSDGPVLTEPVVSACTPVTLRVKLSD